MGFFRTGFTKIRRAFSSIKGFVKGAVAIGLKANRRVLDLIPVGGFPGWVLRRRIIPVSGMFIILGTASYFTSMGVPKSNNHLQDIGSWALTPVWSYILHPTRWYIKTRRGPKLLPIPAIIPKDQIPKTLIITLKGVLTTRRMSMAAGLRLKRRPGIEDFIKRMSQFYEVVVFIEDSPFYSEDILAAIDPNRQYVSGKLGNDSLRKRFRRFYYIDFELLGRDPKNIILIDSGLGGTTFNRDNAILVPCYKGSSNDRTLYELMPFLETLAKKKVNDVRPELAAAGIYGWRNYFQSLADRYNKVAVELNEKPDEEVAEKLLELMQEMPSTFFDHPDIEPKES